MSNNEQLSELRQHIQFALMTATKLWQSVPEARRREIIADTDGDCYSMCFPHTSRGTYYNADIWYGSLSRNGDSITIKKADDATTTALQMVNTFVRLNYELIISNIGVEYENPRTICFGIEYWNGDRMQIESVRRRFREDLLKVIPEYKFSV